MLPNIIKIIKSILVDAVFSLVDKYGAIDTEMQKLLESYPNPKITLTGTDNKELKKCNLQLKNIIYFEHSPEAVKSARFVNINNHL